MASDDSESRTEASDADELAPAIFFFNVQELEEHGRYDAQPKAALFSALLTSTYADECCFRMYSGDLLLKDLAMLPVAAEVNPPSSGARHASSSITYSADMGLFTTIIWDFSDSLREGWSSLALEDNPLQLGRSDVFVLLMTAIPLELLRTLDNALNVERGYLGAALVDMGNPVHRNAAASLPLNFVFRERSLLFPKMELDDEPPCACDGEWWRALNFQFVGDVGFDEVVEVEGLTVLPETPRGAVSQRLLERRRPTTHFERVATSLSSTRKSKRTPSQSAGAVTQYEGTPVVPEAKLTRYSLNLAHEPDGKFKAQAFRDLLGIEANHWRFLAHQLQVGLESAEVHDVRSTEYGVQYHCDIPVRGRNGRTLMVRTGWIVVGDSAPRLTTAYIVDKSQQPPILPPVPEPPIVDIATDAGCLALLSLATESGVAASAACVPTPVFVEGFGALIEGTQGTASIVLPDARHAFVKWLLKNGHAHSAHPGARVSADSSGFLDRELAYSHAFATVLRANGIDCRVESRSD